MGQKNAFFAKRTGEVAENKQKCPENEPERTGKRSGEVVENTYLWKKRTENEATDLIENIRGPKKRTGASQGGARYFAFDDNSQPEKEAAGVVDRAALPIGAS